MSGTRGTSGGNRRTSARAVRSDTPQIRASDEFNFERFVEDLRFPPTDLWLRYLCVNQQMIGDFEKYLDVNILRAQAHAINLRGPEMTEDLLRLQGGVRVLATVRQFVQSFLKQHSESGRVGSRNGTEESDAGRSEQSRQNP